MSDRRKAFRSMSGWILLGLFVFGVWLIPAIHRAQCDGSLHAHAVSGDACSHGHGEPHDGESSTREEEREPLDRRNDGCPLCKLAKLSIQNAPRESAPSFHFSAPARWMPPPFNAAAAPVALWPSPRAPPTA